MYTAVRAGEAVVAIVAAGALVVAIVTVTGGPTTGPGAIGLLFVGVGLARLIPGASFVRTVAEYAVHRRAYAA